MHHRHAKHTRGVSPVGVPHTGETAVVVQPHGSHASDRGYFHAVCLLRKEDIGKEQMFEIQVCEVRYRCELSAV